ncbi:MAG: hypothetical protein AVO38_01720 [delta proteobacterium ML8_D]|nr:MAG: hypothetical protein AVO38_01720 [delta proteobacterium ML8_D]
MLHVKFKNEKIPFLATRKFEPIYFQVFLAWRHSRPDASDDFKFFFGGKFFIYIFVALCLYFARPGNK